jgi:hypothetical protein
MPHAPNIFNAPLLKMLGDILADFQCFVLPVVVSRHPMIPDVGQCRFFLGIRSPVAEIKYY